MDFDAHHPGWFFEDERHDDAVQALKDYFDPGHFITGAWFEKLADHGLPNQITAKDLIAVSTLAVNIPARKSIWILEDGAGKITELLEKIPADQAIWDHAADMSPRGPIWKLWKLIEHKDSACPSGYGGMGNAMLSKLLAAKRPDLVPLHDSLVDQALFKTTIPNYWAPWTRLHRSPEGAQLRETVKATRDEAGVGRDLGSLRIIDIVIWTWAKRHGIAGQAPSEP